MTDVSNDNPPGTPEPRYKGRRLTDEVLLAFHYACDHEDTVIARRLLNVLEFMNARAPDRLIVADRRARDGLVAAHERFWPLRHLALGEC
jgi:hypothetical protein